MIKKRIKIDCVIGLDEEFQYFDSLKYDIIRLIKQSYPFELLEAHWEVSDSHSLISQSQVSP